jgi:hypothetical protein
MPRTKLRGLRRFKLIWFKLIWLNPIPSKTDRRDTVKSTNQIQREARPTIITAVIAAKIGSTEYDATSVSIISQFEEAAGRSPIAGIEAPIETQIKRN